MKNGKLIEIDGAALRKALYKQWESLTIPSRELGFSDAYFSQVCNRNLINQVGVNYLAKNGILFEEYAPKKPEPIVEVKPDPEPIADEFSPKECAMHLVEGMEGIITRLDEIESYMDKENLENLIYKTVYVAIKHALKDINQKG